MQLQAWLQYNAFRLRWESWYASEPGALLPMKPWLLRVLLLNPTRHSLNPNADVVYGGTTPGMYCGRSSLSQCTPVGS